MKHLFITISNQILLCRTLLTNMHNFKLFFCSGFYMADLMIS